MVFYLMLVDVVIVYFSMYRSCLWKKFIVFKNGEILVRNMFKLGDMEKKGVS